MANRLVKGICVGIKFMPEKIKSDKMCRAEEDLRLTGEIDVEPGNINFPFGGPLLQAIQFCVGSGCISL
jgi:hypothetical protein